MVSHKDHAVNIVFELSGFVACDLSGRHSHLKEGAYETDGVVTGDPEDEIRRSIRRLECREADTGGSGGASGDERAQFPALSGAVRS